MNYTQNEKIEQVTDSTMLSELISEARYIMQELLTTEDANLQNVFSFHNDLGVNSFNFGLRHLSLRIKRPQF